MTPATLEALNWDLIWKIAVTLASILIGVYFLIKSFLFSVQYLHRFLLYSFAAIGVAACWNFARQQLWLYVRFVELCHNFVTAVVNSVEVTNELPTQNVQ